MMSNTLRAAAAAGALLLAQDAGFAPVRPDFAWSFPRDHWAHPAYRTEWWYFTGHLAADGDTTPRFGYQFTFFRIGLVPPARARPDTTPSGFAATGLIMGHAAVTDLRSGRHVFSEVLYRAGPLLGGFGAPGDTLVAWSRAPAGTDGRWTLRWTGAGFAFAMTDRRAGLAMDLATTPERPLVFQGPNGLSRKGPDPSNASLYYSITRLATHGTLALGRDTLRVAGRSWMDKEISSTALAPGHVGWDWFSLQLDDGRDLMLYVLRDSAGGTAWAEGTVVGADGRPRWLRRDDFTVRVAATWRSDSSGATYPARWTVTLPSAGLALDIAPLAADQENRSQLARRLFYWEGAVRVRSDGRAAGRGFVELTGYGNGLRPAI